MGLSVTVVFLLLYAYVALCGAETYLARSEELLDESALHHLGGGEQMHLRG